MQKIYTSVTDKADFFKGHSPFDLVEKYGSPLYVYNENIIRTRIKELKNMMSYKNFEIHYSAKANSNIAILQIAKDEGISIDAMSPGELYAETLAGFTSDKIFFVSNNMSKEEMQYVIDRNVLMCVDSICQLELYGQLNPNSKVAIRFNAAVGAGHHEKVITAGKNTKFGIPPTHIDEIKDILSKYNLKLAGIMQHIGSLFMDGTPYSNSCRDLLEVAKHFEDLDFIDIGGGLGIPYRKQDGDAPLDLKSLGDKLDTLMFNFSKEYGKEISLKIEPGRYIVAESGVLLGTVHAAKESYGTKYIGTDLGFNVLARPVMYDSHHDIEIYRNSDKKSNSNEVVNIVGNICESGDIISKNVSLPEIFIGDILGVLDAGAYGHVMSSNYNYRMRPAEILIRENGDIALIRKRDTIEEIVQNQILL